METNILKDGTIKEGTPESVGIASGHIANYLMRLRDIDYDIHSLQIVKDGKLMLLMKVFCPLIVKLLIIFGINFRIPTTKDLKILRYMIFLQCSQDRIQMRRLCFL